MKFGYAAAIGLLTFTATANGNVVRSEGEKSLEARLWAATDARDAANPVFDEAIAAGNYRALILLGQIGGDACKRLIPFFDHAEAAIARAAHIGAALCQDEALSAPLLASGGGESVSLDPALAGALGFSGGAAGIQWLVAAVNAAGAGDADAPAILAGLMQAIVYDRREAGQMTGLDFGHILDLTQAEATGLAAAYLLTRFQKLNDVLDRGAVEAALHRAPRAAQPPLVRVLAQFGDGTSGSLIGLATKGERAVRLEAVRALGRLTDGVSQSYLIGAAQRDDAFVRQLALSALAGRAEVDPEARAIIRQSLTDNNRWLATTALDGLAGFDEASANAQAALWLAGDDYYLAYKAINMLAGNEAGKTSLQAYADAHPTTTRGHDAAVALDPSIEAVTKARATPSTALVNSYAGRELVLHTTRGNICIQFEPDAPYAATNFGLLADAGKMDGMLWHRVIPNFVAQAGQIEDPAINDWGSIRDEWIASDHKIGTVGLATAGKDTGGTQFFINTADNLHLNGQYTVFGHVVEGMNAALKLEEGDLIERAFTAVFPSAHCK